MNHAVDYETLRAAAVKVTGDLLDRLVRKCQENPWLRVGGVEFEDGLHWESDYPYGLERYDDREMLKAFFAHGNWSIRSAVQHGDLIFVQQVNGGDEWWTLKVAGDALVAFESLSCALMIQTGRFDGVLDRMLRATPEACAALEY